MSPNIQSTNQAINLLYKVISRTILTMYRTSTPLLMELTTRKNRGQSPDSTQGWYDRFENNTMYLDMANNAIFATPTQPTAKFAFGQENISQFAIPAVTIYNSVQYTEFVNQITTSDRGAVTKFADRVIRDMTNGYKRTLNRTLWGTVSAAPATTDNGGAASALAYTATSGATTNTVDITSLDANGDRYAGYYLTNGMPVQIVGATGGTSIPGNVAATFIQSVISSTSGLTATVTVTDNLTFPSGAALTLVSSDGSQVIEPQGMQAIVQTTNPTVQGVNLASLPQGLPHVATSVGTFTVSQYQRLRNACQLGKPNTEWCNQTVYDALAESVLPQERTGMGTSSYLDIGYSSYTSHQGTVQVILDYDVPGGQLFGLYLPAFTLGILRDVSFLPMGTIRIPNYAAMEIAMQWVGNLGASLVEPNFAMYGITSV